MFQLAAEEIDQMEMWFQLNKLLFFCMFTYFYFVLTKKCEERGSTSENKTPLEDTHPMRIWRTLGIIQNNKEVTTQNQNVKK